MTKPLTVGIDLGGTQVRCALLEGGKIIRRAAERTDVKGGPAAVLSQFERLIASVCSGEERARAGSVGVCCPGPLDTETGTVLGIPTLPGWEDFPLRAMLQDQLDLPVVVENDGIAAAYGEWRHGAGQGLQHLVYVTVSTGIGGGAIVDGRLLHGRRGMAAHVGHLHMDPGGPICSCGATGCFEALASGTALGLRARASAAQFPESHLGIAARQAAIDAMSVAEGARAGDRHCLALLKEEAMLLGQGFTGLIHLFSPEEIIMGGGVSQCFDLLAQDIHEVIQKSALPPFRDVRIVPASLGDNSGLVGAATLAAEMAGQS